MLIILSTGFFIIIISSLHYFHFFSSFHLSLFLSLSQSVFCPSGQFKKKYNVHYLNPWINKIVITWYVFLSVAWFCQTNHSMFLPRWWGLTVFVLHICCHCDNVSVFLMARLISLPDSEPQRFPRVTSGHPFVAWIGYQMIFFDPLDSIDVLWSSGCTCIL